MAEAKYDHVDPRTDAEVAADEAKAKARSAKDKARKAPAQAASKTSEPKPVKSK